MQFSLRILMAFVLLAALLISGWISERRVRQLSLREILIHLELQDTTSRVGDFEQQKTLNDRFFKADEKRIREYSSANERFQEIASRYGSLEIADERKLAIIAVPQWDLPGVRTCLVLGNRNDR
jgi:DNA repair ATPase RecN